MSPTTTWSCRALGTTAVIVVADPAALRPARRIALTELRAIDLACSRFRADSELLAVNAGAGSPVAAGALLRTALRAALAAAEETGGLVDPTVGRSLRLAGYDRTFRTVRLRDGSRLWPRFEPAGRWRSIEIDDEAGTIRIPAGVELDLGATAKALAADRIATLTAAATGCGVLVSLGGDVAVSGTAPEEGWVVGIDDDHRTLPEHARNRIALHGGGIASSGTRVRRWASASGPLHHILDPRTGAPASGPWATVSVAAGSCLEANIASTAAVVLGTQAPAWLAARGLPARLAAHDGSVLTVARWPAEQVAA